MCLHSSYTQILCYTFSILRIYCVMILKQIKESKQITANRLNKTTKLLLGQLRETISLACPGSAQRCPSRRPHQETPWNHLKWRCSILISSSSLLSPFKECTLQPVSKGEVSHPSENFRCLYLVSCSFGHSLKLVTISEDRGVDGPVNLHT